MLSLLALLVTFLSVAREREQGTFDQLLVTLLRPFEILIGKATPGFVIGLALIAGFTLTAAAWLFQPATDKGYTSRLNGSCFERLCFIPIVTR